MRSVIGPAMLAVGTILVSSMFAVLKSLDHVDPIVRASWRLQTTFLALASPSAVSVYCARLNPNRKVSLLPPVATVWSGCGYALYNLGLCVALAKTSLLRASILSQCAPLFIVLYKVFRNRCCRSGQSENGGGDGGVHWKHMLGVLLTLVGTGVFISSTTNSHDNLDEGGDLETKEGQGSVLQSDFHSQLIGDLAAAAASMGYATYISCGQRARRSVPVYIHLPGCVFVAMILVSISCFVALDVTVFVAPESSTMEETGGFCSSVVGWTCPQYLPRIAYLGIVCGAIAVGLINWSLNLVSTLQAAAANSAEPIAASIIGIIFYSEPVPNFAAILAAGIIILAMLLCSADDGTSKTITNSQTEATDSKVPTPDARKSLYKFTSVQFLFLKGFIVFSLVLMQCLLIYFSEDYLPEISKLSP